MSCSAAAAATRAGVGELISLDLLRVFTAPELACLLGGEADISVQDWREHTTYGGGYCRASDQVKWLWRLIDRLGPDERTLLLKFTTVRAHHVVRRRVHHVLHHTR